MDFSIRRIDGAADFRARASPTPFVRSATPRRENCRAPSHRRQNVEYFGAVQPPHTQGHDQSAVLPLLAST